ncbi:MAG TPA: PaaX family transcriptional regulator C-terminal domain-containing protein [Trebonia sp.]|nr:PaaX family transcriptional regulator C-terminal domain-containing protein [Trebonia sp.]
MTIGEFDEQVSLPRPQAGAQPQHLLITLLGDYWSGRMEPLPSAALVALVNEFGISTASARAALARLAKRGVMSVAKSGRRTLYSPTLLTGRTLLEGRDRVFSFGRDVQQRWDGFWLVVVFSVPEEQREIRHLLRTRLRWLGFGPLDDGVWVSPHDMTAEVTAALTECGVAQATVLRSLPVVPEGSHLRHPLAAWNLDELRGNYDQFIGKFAPLLDRVKQGQVSVSEALVERTAIMDTWRTFPHLDPDLPDSVLPANWPRTQACEIFTETYDTLGPLAEFRFRQIIAAYAPELAPLASHFTTQTALKTAGGAREREAVRAG